jgi:hypothetical protein
MLEVMRVIMKKVISSERKGCHSPVKELLENAEYGRRQRTP